MTESFDKEFWDAHWSAGGAEVEVNPHLVAVAATLAPGAALDVGAGLGTEAAWLASQGWQVTAIDIATAGDSVPGVDWITADATTWEPSSTFDLVTTHYAHPSIPPLDFYRRLAGWVAPGGTVLIVAHAPGGHHPHEATAGADAIVALLDGWTIEVAETRERSAGGHQLTDVVVCATRPA